MNTQVIFISILTAIAGFFIGRYIVRYRNERRKRENDRRVRKIWAPSTNLVPVISFTINRNMDGFNMIVMSGNMEEVCDLFATELRANKELRDMLKKAFLKANKAIA